MLKIILIVSLFIINLIQAQDITKLKLVGTITGDSYYQAMYGQGIGDINGDGYADFITSSYNEDPKWRPLQTKLYFGSENFDTIPEYTFEKKWIYPLGDINNDNYDDIMYVEFVHQPMLNGYHIFRLVLGKKDFDLNTSWEFQTENYYDMIYTHLIEAIGDLNNDGFRDFVISSPHNWTNGYGYVYIFYGGNKISNIPIKIIKQLKTNESPFYGEAVTGIGDANEDGNGDILIKHMQVRNEVFFGGATMSDTTDYILPPVTEIYNIGYNSNNNIGDINKDGKDEFCVNGFVYYNLDSIIKVLPATYISNGGDVNGDGYDDFMITNDNDYSVRLYFGGEKLDTTKFLKLDQEQKWSLFGNNTNIAGDIDNDGKEEIIIPAPLFKENNKEVGKIYIYAYDPLNGIDEENIEINSYNLAQNYPNPFNPSTTITFSMPEAGYVKIKVFNTLGQEVKALLNEYKQAGNYEVTFNGIDLTSGVYIYQLSVNGNTFSKKMVLMK